MENRTKLDVIVDEAREHCEAQVSSTLEQLRRRLRKEQIDLMEELGALANRETPERPVSGSVSQES